MGHTGQANPKVEIIIVLFLKYVDSEKKILLTTLPQLSFPLKSQQSGKFMQNKNLFSLDFGSTWLTNKQIKTTSPDFHIVFPGWDGGWN